MSWLKKMFNNEKQLASHKSFPTILTKVALERGIFNAVVYIIYILQISIFINNFRTRGKKCLQRAQLVKILSTVSVSQVHFILKN